MKILSWDIGIKNLAYCLINIDANNTNIIEDWNIIKVTEDAKENVYIITQKLIEQIKILDFENKNIDVILIENQPVLKNPKMKTIQTVLYSYFLIKKLELKIFNEIKFISASLKLKVYDGPEIEIQSKSKNKYIITKKLAVAHTKYFLKDNHLMLNFFTNHNKKDDLADCYLQSLFYIKKNIK